MKTGLVYKKDLLAGKIWENDEGYFFQVFVVGDFLNKNVNEERTSFNFTQEEDEDEW